MKTIITSIIASGYGHKKITIMYRNGREYSATTNDMPLVDSYNSDRYTHNDEVEHRRSECALIGIVKSAHNLR